MATKQVRIDAGLYRALRRLKKRTMVPVVYMLNMAVEAWLGRKQKGGRA